MCEAGNNRSEFRLRFDSCKIRIIFDRIWNSGVRDFVQPSHRFGRFAKERITGRQIVENARMVCSGFEHLLEILNKALIVLHFIRLSGGFIVIRRCAGLPLRRPGKSHQQKNETRREFFHTRHFTMENARCFWMRDEWAESPVLHIGSNRELVFFANSRLQSFPILIVIFQTALQLLIFFDGLMKLIFVPVSLGLCK